MKVSIKDLKGATLSEVEVGFEVIENGRGSQAVHDAVVAYQAAQRSGTACTKTMGEVAGTGKKPWRQKGTGRARAGSFQSPLWRGGGVVFGPKPRDYSKRVGRSTRKLALRKALGERLKGGDVIVLESLKVSSPKTKEFVAAMKGLGISGTALIVTAPDRNLSLAARNVANVELASSEGLNTYQVLKPSKLVFTREAFEAVVARLQ